MTKQDRFRFRVWSVKRKEYHKLPTYNYIGGTFNLCSYENDIIEQSTGLKDKNGKLIYEGDIIKQGNSIYKVIFSYDDVASCGCCVGRFSGCGFVMEDKYGSRGDLDIYSELEVIGNVNENPELLENKDE